MTTMNKESKPLLANPKRALALEIKMAKVRIKDLKQRMKENKRMLARYQAELLGAESVLSKLLAKAV
jgi:hypothetical protein